MVKAIDRCCSTLYPESGEARCVAAGENLTLSWGTSCVTNNGFSIYEGVLGDWTSHVPLSCSLPFPTATFTESAENAYFLVVPNSYNLIPPDVEGSYGTLRDGSERRRSSQACIPEQAIVPCPEHIGDQSDREVTEERARRKALDLGTQVDTWAHLSSCAGRAQVTSMED